MREIHLRDYLFDHPELLFDKPVLFKAKEVCVEGKFIDLLFDVADVQYIVELKRDTITREAVGQVLEYYGRLRCANPTRAYRMILAAPSIPRYRSLPLEEFGIRCVELTLPQSDVAAKEDTSAATHIRAAVAGDARHQPDAAIPSLREAGITFEQLAPPSAGSAVGIANRFLQDAIPSVVDGFAPYEVKPVRMSRATPDVLCFPVAPNSTQMTFTGGGAWWAFAFGASDHMAKNDTPNISVNALPWGLDIAVNAELQPSQKVLISRVAANPAVFNSTIEEHGQLALQLWLKLEHQPRFYHWVLLDTCSPGNWSADDLLREYAVCRNGFHALRDHWLSAIFSQQPSLSNEQAAHLKRSNQNINLAVRIVHTLKQEHAVWGLPYAAQVAILNREYIRLRHVIQYFN